ncbi:hypothetical protein FACS1894172_06960 [Spirochaetia bacterium]|nr:hypothetical protein FACS1894164_08670 [Spirochaetia bacterium]GHU31670.1 hypothetical protein FACS1894172_06960 [Spirochaetia bacterium]
MVLFLLMIGLVFVSCGQESPVIQSIDPRLGVTGTVVTLNGEHFGAEQSNSYISVGGIIPTASSYVEWRDDCIQFKTPEFFESGVIIVYTGTKQSNPVFYATRTSLPEPVLYSAIPLISAMQPAASPVGEVVSIIGSKFGSIREDSVVLFSGISGENPEWIPVTRGESGYILWNDREIQVRVPDGAISGTCIVQSRSGNSNAIPFSVVNRLGSKTTTGKKTWTISYAVEVHISEARSPNTLFLWVPVPAVGASQRNVQLLSQTSLPSIEQYQGTKLFRLDNLSRGDTFFYDFSYQIDEYEIRTTIAGATTSNTAPVTIPAQRAEPAIRTQMQAIVANERDPYLRARRIYEWLIREFTLTKTPMQMTIPDALEKKSADSYMFALVFCALANAAGVQTIPVAGFLVNDIQRTTAHYWAECWIDGFGWIPADPVLGYGNAPDLFEMPANPVSFYFGNLDNRRIIFSRGENILPHMDPRGNPVSRDRSYTLQNFWEEKVGNLDYQITWSQVEVTG